MALLEAANEDLQINFVNTGGPPDLAYQGDQGIDAVKIVPTKSTTCKAETKFICTTGITITWAGPTSQCPFTSALYNFVAGAGTISPLAIKTKCDNQVILRKDDIGACVGSWTLKVTPFTVSPCACNLKIANAGQTSVKGQ